MAHSYSNITLIVSAVWALAACSPKPLDVQNVTYPTDEQISTALEAQLKSDPNAVAARELVQTLGGEKGQLKYAVHRVIYRGGAFEVHYDAVLKMGQAGEQSLQALYTRMIPEADRSKLPDNKLPTYLAWLKAHAEALQKNPAPQEQVQGKALSATLTHLDECYSGVKPGAEVLVMTGLGAQLWPERSGLYAEKLAMPSAAVRCLPL